MSNDTYFDDSWFSGVKTAEGVDYYRTIKTSRKVFLLAVLEKFTKECPGGSHIFMKSDPIVPGGRPLMSIGYKYNYRNVLGFIDTGGYGSTETDSPYLSRFPDNYSNVSICPVVLPRCC